MDDAPASHPATSKIVHVYAMLAIYFGVFLVLLAFQLLRPAGGGIGAAGGAAHSPAEFPEIFEQPLLHDLDSLEGGEAGEKLIDVPPAPFSKGIFPCSECHEPNDASRRPRKMDEPHEAIVLEHGEKQAWCFTCHSAANRDRLALADGTEVEFAESYRLCGQCHGTVLRDWRAGVHGRRMGRWDGHKKYLLCAHCHDPHSPGFKPVKPLPPPVLPGKSRGGAEH